MLKAYLDDSGHSRDPAEKICCIAGCSCLEVVRAEFEEQWNKALQDFSVPYLHMREFAHSVSDSPFTDWKDDTERRDRFISSLLGVIERYAVGVYGATVPLSEWNGLDDERKKQLQDPFFMCLQEILVQCATFAQLLNHLIEIEMSDQSENRGKAYKMYKYIREHHPIGPRLASFSFVSFKANVLVQAADLIAFEVRRLGADLEVPKATPLRVPMKRLLKTNYFFRFFTRDEIVRRFYDIKANIFS